MLQRLYLLGGEGGGFTGCSMSGTEQPCLTSVAFPDGAVYRFHSQFQAGWGFSPGLVNGTCEQPHVEKPQRSGMAAQYRSCCFCLPFQRMYAENCV